MQSSRSPWNSLFTACLLLACMVFLADIASAQTKSHAPSRLRLSAGKSLIVNSQADIARVSIADPNVADFVLLSPRQVYVTAKTTGGTTLTLWDATEKVHGIYDVEVVPDVNRFKRILGEVMPEETGVEIRPANNTIAVSGTVKSEENLRRIMSLAEAHAPGKVLNLMQVGGVHQVMLEVKVAEVQRSLLKRLGVNLNVISQGDFLFTFLGGLTSVSQLQNIITTATRTVNGVLVADPFNRVNNPTRLDNQRGALAIDPKVTGMVNVNTDINGRPVNWGGFIDLLKDNGMLKILAEPTLVCLNGQSAEFLAGGEIPVPVPQALGTVTIEWKKFGVELQFTPHVLSSSKISMKVTPSVSDLDFTKAIQIGSFVIPAILKRSASTVVELGDGQSFAIAGLLREDGRDAAKKFPAIGDIPVLGGLFKSSEYQSNQTELLIVITPRLAKPIEAQDIKLPTDGFPKAPDDIEFYLGIDRKALGGKPAAQQQSPPVTPASFDGDFGNSVPPVPVQSR